MLRRTVTAPDGRTWTLGRRWLPKRRRLGRFKSRDVGDLSPGLDIGDDIIGLIVGAIVTIVVLFVLALVLFNVVAIAIELLLLVILLLGGIIGRVVFRRPWTVFAASDSEVHYTPVVGWRASRREIDGMASRIASGARLEPAPGDGR